MLIHPERLDELEAAVGAAAEKLAELEDAAGEAKAHTVRAGCLARLGRVGDCEIALDHALTAARRAREHRRVNAVLAGAPLAALWGPNPVPRAGGRCLDVVRLLRITTDSPAVEATSTRCQAVLEAFRGRAAAARRMIDSARRTVTELGLRHALLEVEQFAGIVELVVDDPAAAEPHLRQAYNGFRRMGLDADTAESAALLGRACLALDRDAEADELCSESERLAGHALKALIAWRTVRAQLLSRRGDNDEARRVAEAAVRLAERTDGLVDHGDACQALATVLGAAGDAAGAKAAADRAVDLYEQKGAAALAEKARRIVGERDIPTAPAATEAPTAKLDNACVRVIHQTDVAFERGAWDEAEKMYAPNVFVESRRKMVGFTQADLRPGDWPRVARHLREGWAWNRNPVIAVRGEHLALTRIELGTDDASPGAPHEEFLGLWGLDENGRIALQVFFDIEDIDAAMAELDAAHARLEEHLRAPLENAASRADARLNALFADRTWDEISAMFTDDIRVEDRRRGLRREGDDRATMLAEIHAIADLGTTNMTSGAVAMRGERLALVRTLYSGRDQAPDAFHTELLRIAEIDEGGRIAAFIVFDLDDIDAALEELDARYLAGEAAADAHTWSVIARARATLARQELPPTTPDWVNLDHRRGIAFRPGDVTAYIRANWDLEQDFSTYIEVVHRLNHLGAVFTQVARGKSQEGFDAEWRVVELMTVQGDLINRAEFFDESDLDAALARFDELSRPVSRLENAASRVNERYTAYYVAGDLAAMADLLADDLHSRDRRRVVNADLHGRDAVIESLRYVTELGGLGATSITIATRGEHLALIRIRYWLNDKNPDEFHINVLQVIEIDADERITAFVTFDLDDIDAAFAELDARYLADEAAEHSRTWSVITRGFAAIKGRELPATAPDFIDIDRRRTANIDAGDMKAFLRTALELTPEFTSYVETVNRLSDLRAVVTQVAHGKSQDGFEAEWRVIEVFTVEGELLSRCEAFDEVDLDVALARFDELSQPPRRLENAASRLIERLRECLATGNWSTVAELLADDICVDDRRPVVSAGVLHGRDVDVAHLRAIADIGVRNITSNVVAIRGQHVVLGRVRLWGRDQRPGAFHTELLELVEIDTESRIAARVLFDVDDIDAAFEELDARYLAGEAAAHAHTWSVVARAYAVLNRRGLPATTPDWVNIDHRRGTAFAPGDMTAYIRATWDVTPDICYRIEAVHRLSTLGAVVTHVSNGTSHGGFDAEWRVTNLYTVDGDLINRCEMFDETGIDAALARFDELHPQARRLENAASRAYERLWTYFAARDWKSMAEILADDVFDDDRRRVVNAGLRRGRDAEMANMRATADLGVANVTSDVIAIRGERLAISRVRFLGRNQRPEAFHTEVLGIDADERIAAAIMFDLDDVDAAFAELDARYLAGEAAPHAHTWSVIAEAYAALNRHELPATTADWVNIDHRRGIVRAR